VVARPAVGADAALTAARLPRVKVPAGAAAAGAPAAPAGGGGAGALAPRASPPPVAHAHAHAVVTRVPGGGVVVDGLHEYHLQLLLSSGVPVETLGAHSLESLRRSAAAIEAQQRGPQAVNVGAGYRVPSFGGAGGGSGGARAPLGAARAEPAPAAPAAAAAPAGAGAGASGAGGAGAGAAPVHAGVGVRASGAREAEPKEVPEPRRLAGFVADALPDGQHVPELMVSVRSEQPLSALLAWLEVQWVGAPPLLTPAQFGALRYSVDGLHVHPSDLVSTLYVCLGGITHHTMHGRALDLLFTARLG
jgi:hypothetical protein